jgi:alkylhydroperoxidase/carboxymuconolactone decarboxylase family protein YurZ
MHGSPDLAHLEAGFRAAHGYWNDELSALARMDPDYFFAYSSLLQVAARRGHLTATQRELVCLAVNAAVTHLHSQATRTHVGLARQAGASDREISETLELASSLGVHSILLGLPELHAALVERGQESPVGDEVLDAHQRELKDRFQQERKYWTEHWDTVLTYAPEFFEAYLEISRIPWVDGVLEEYFRELVYVAIDVSTTHLFTSGVKVHIRKALGYGATPGQVTDVMILASTIGQQSALLGAPALLDPLPALRPDGEDALPR